MLDLDLPSDWPSGALSPSLSECLLASSIMTGPLISGLASLPSSRASLVATNASASSGQSFDIDPSIILDFPLANCPSPRPAITATAVAEENTLTEAFPDSYLLPVPELKVLQAFMRLSKSLHCKSSFWDLTAVSSFNDESIQFNSKVLSSSFAPTRAQKTIPHHPIIDFLPWPAVRDRLIGVFSLPDDMRPPHASGPMALVQLAYDMEDSAEGIRIWGDSPCQMSHWEIGQVFFQRWWFVFDRQVIEQSNRWRLLRGAPELRIACPYSKA
jgi:hypothetical protein